MLRADSSWAEAGPLSRLTIVMGDFNIKGMEPAVDCMAPGSHGERRGSGSHQGLWGRTLSSLTEISDGDPSHFASASGRSSRPNLIYTSLLRDDDVRGDLAGRRPRRPEGVALPGH